MESSSRRLKEKDSISQLPNALICDILSHLPTKEAVRTSILSTTWRNIWLYVPSFELNSRDFHDLNAFLNFGDRFFDDRVSCLLDKVKLTIDEHDDDTSCITSWIYNAVKRKIQHLDVKCQYLEYNEMSLTKSRLVDLKLALVSFDDAEFVSLPCLKTLHLEDNFYLNEATFERLVSSFPVLEELKIIGCSNRNAKVFRVRSRSLERLTISIRFYAKDIGSGIVIDAPQLGFLGIKDNLPETFTITSINANAKLDISLAFPSKRSSIRRFFLGILKIKDMKICSKTMNLIYQYSNVEALPRFDIVSRLCVTLCSLDLQWLPTFLQSCKNLKCLVLKWEDELNCLVAMNEIRLLHEDEPQCLSSSLEFVDFETNLMGYVSEMELIKYFLTHSVILKKLTLRLYACARQYDIFNKLLKIPRRSTSCQVIVSHGFQQFYM